MLVNILFWIAITLIIFPYGLVFSRLLQINVKDTSPFLLIIIGILPIIILTTIWGFFYRINIEILILLIILSIFLYYINWSNVKKKWQELIFWVIELSLVLKISLIAFILITGLQASMPTNIPDNGYYYLQTIKWANEAGISLGVARFGFQYGQFSSWHIIQSLFNLSNLFGNQFNTINGWFIIINVLWATMSFARLNKSSRVYLVFFVFVSSVLLFFNTAPSPDLVVILLSLIVFKYFLFDEPSKSNIRIIIVLPLIAVAVKLSAFYLIFFAIWFGYKHILKEKKLITLTALVILLLLSKNLITTGSIFFPFDIYTPSWVEWKVDEKILDEGKTIIKNSPLVADYSEFLKDFSVAQKVNSWFNHQGYRGLANKLWLFGILFLGIAAILYKDKSTFLIFSITAIHFSILWVISPNYRFAIAVILLIYYLLINHLIKSFLANFVNYLLPIALFTSIIWITPLIHPLQKLSSNQIISNSYSIKAVYLLTPSLPFISESYEKKMFNGEVVYIPPGYHYAWDGPLPCVMRSHYEKYNQSND